MAGLLKDTDLGQTTDWMDEAGENQNEKESRILHRIQIFALRVV